MERMRLVFINSFGMELTTYSVCVPRIGEKVLMHYRLQAVKDVTYVFDARREFIDSVHIQCESID